jgi:hypothetical protein
LPGSAELARELDLVLAASVVAALAPADLARLALVLAQGLRALLTAALRMETPVLAWLA